MFTLAVFVLSLRWSYGLKHSNIFLGLDSLRSGVQAYSVIYFLVFRLKGSIIFLLFKVVLSAISVVVFDLIMKLLSRWWSGVSVCSHFVFYA